MGRSKGDLAQSASVLYRYPKAPLRDRTRLYGVHRSRLRQAPWWPFLSDTRKSMDRQAFGRSRAEADKASQKIVAIRNARTLPEIADHWSGFLTDIQRAYTKLRIACREGPSKGWCDNVFGLRNTDELLRYV